MPGRARVTDYSKAIRKEIFAELRRRLAACCRVVLARWKELLSVDGTGLGAGGKLAYGANPSRPGEPPHVQTGRLRASATFEIVGLVARIGTNLLYGLVLEMGGGHVAERPSLRRAMKECRDECERIMSRPMGR